MGGQTDRTIDSRCLLDARETTDGRSLETRQRQSTCGAGWAILILLDYCTLVQYTVGGGASPLRRSPFPTEWGNNDATWMVSDRATGRYPPYADPTSATVPMELCWVSDALESGPRTGCDLVWEASRETSLSALPRCGETGMARNRKADGLIWNAQATRWP